MAEITKTIPPDFWSTTGVAMTMTADTAATFPITGKTMLIAQNVSSGDTVTIDSTAESKTGRTGSVSQAIAQNEVRLFLLLPDGWIKGTDIDTTAADAQTKFGAMDLP